MQIVFLERNYENVEYKVFSLEVIIVTFCCSFTSLMLDHWDFNLEGLCSVLQCILHFVVGLLVRFHDFHGLLVDLDFASCYKFF